MTESSSTLADLIAAGKIEERRNQMPSRKELCIDYPLYRPAEVDDLYLEELRTARFQFDAHCVQCDKEAVFQYITSYSGSDPRAFAVRPGFFTISLLCGRAKHVYQFYFLLKNDLKLLKVGQSPSIADIGSAELRKYKSVLKGNYYQELVKADGLNSHGIGIGSFVYLRRIFESLIETHKADFESSNGPIDGFDRLYMGQKINALKDVLPAVLVRNSATYGILSSGIHSLSENECKEYYPVVKQAILQILEQDLENRERRRREEELERSIAAISQSLTR